MSAVTDLTAEQRQIIADAARILDEHRDPRSPEEIRAEAEAEEYRQRIAESERNFLADPAAQRLAAEGSRKVAADHERELAHMRFLAKQDPRALADARVAGGGGDKSLWRCHECFAPTYTNRLVGGSISMCERCWANHRLHCDACSRKDVITSYCPPDGKWRCPACQATFRSEYAANPAAFRNPHGVGALTLMNRR